MIDIIDALGAEKIIKYKPSDINKFKKYFDLILKDSFYYINKTDEKNDVFDLVDRNDYCILDYTLYITTDISKTVYFDENLFDTLSHSSEFGDGIFNYILDEGYEVYTSDIIDFQNIFKQMETFIENTCKNNNIDNYDNRECLILLKSNNKFIFIKSDSFIGITGFDESYVNMLTDPKITLEI